MTELDHPLVRDYLARVEELSTALPPGRRTALRADLEEHLTEAVAATDGSDVAVAGVLAWLGTPESVVAEAAGSRVAPTAPTTPDDGARLELAALVCFWLSLVTAATFVLTFVVAPVLWVAGVVLTLFSRRWTPADKALAVVAYGVLGVPLLVGGLFSPLGMTTESCSEFTGPDGSTTETCTSDTPGWQPVLLGVVGVALLALWVWAGIRLYRRARRPLPAEEARGIRV